MESKVLEVIPGPGTYNLNLNQVKKQIAASKFNKSRRDSLQINEKNPGPGAYEYSSANKFHHPVTSFCNSPRSTEKEQNRPGPGTY